MRSTIGFKIFGIAVALLILMGAAALLSLRMTHTVDDQLAIVDENYVPAYISLAQAEIRAADESSLLRRLYIALTETPRDDAKVQDLRTRSAAAAKDANDQLIAARKHVNEQIADPIDFNDNVELGRLDTRAEFLEGERAEYETAAARAVAAATARQPDAAQRLDDLDTLRDRFNLHIEQGRIEMQRLADGAIDSTRAYQIRAVEVSLLLLVIAGMLGVTVAAAVTMGLVRPVRRLLAGTAAVEGGALDTVVPITSRDEIGRLTLSFNTMVGELRTKAQIRETFGKYVDPRIVSGLIDRPELTDPKGARREMTIMFCDMQGFTSFSEGMTPAGLVTVLNRYLTVISEPVRRNNGIIDKYIGDAVMAFWGQPFNGADEQARLACFAALEQIASLPGFQAELPELLGMRRGFPTINLRVGIATGEVVVGSIGSEMSRNYTVIGDTVNKASRLEGACKAYGTRTLISEATQRLAGEAIETREIDSVVVVGKTEAERVFEILGRKGEISVERLELRDAYAAALADYRARRWEKAVKGFRDCLSIVPDDPPSQVLLSRIAHFAEHVPADDWNGVWALAAK